jgi:hypothetical protein
MIPRRTLLHGIATAGTLGLAGLAGCSAFARGVEGYVQLKSIAGVTDRDGTRSEESILRVQLSSPPGDGPPELVQYSDEWFERFENPREPLVSDDLHEDLRRAYDDVRYVVGVCSPKWADDDERIGCYNVATTRENYNRVQVHQAVRASSDGTSLTIHSVDDEWSFDDDGR